MKVLITGAAGFLGSHIVECALDRGHEVHVALRASSRSAFLDSLGTRITRHIADLADAEAVTRALDGIDLVIHSAGRVTDSGLYETFYRDNVLATQNLLDAARKQGVRRFVFVSSPSIFSGADDHIRVDESIPYPERFMNYYAETKAISEQLALAADGAELMTVSLRPRGIWGERDYNGFFPKFLKALERGKLPDFAGDKPVQASLCHARNMAEACFQAAEHLETTHGQAYFITDDEDVRVWDLIRDVARRLGLPPPGKRPSAFALGLAIAIVEGIWTLPYLKGRYSPPISRYALSMLTQHTTYDVSKAKRDFGYAPKYAISRNLDDFLLWIEKEGGLKRYIGRQ